MIEKTTQTFKQFLEAAVSEEQDDSRKYMQRAQEAPTEEDRKVLIDIAKQEIMHRAMLECMLLTYEEVSTK